MHSEFTLKVRKEQPPMCGGRALKINSEIPVVQAKQTTAKSVYSREIYKPGQSGVEETLTAPNSKFDYSTLHREIKGKEPIISDPDLFADDITKKALSAKHGRNNLQNNSLNRKDIIHTSHDNKMKGAFTDREKKSFTHLESRNLGGSQRGLKMKKEIFIFSHVNFI